MKIWAVKKEYLTSVATDVDVIREAVELLNEIASQEDDNGLYPWENEYGTSFEIPSEGVRYVFEKSGVAEKLEVENRELFDFFDDLRKLFEENASLSSIFLEIEE